VARREVRRIVEYLLEEAIFPLLRIPHWSEGGLVDKTGALVGFGSLCGAASQSEGEETKRQLFDPRLV